jgi:hypothetical protein
MQADTVSCSFLGSAVEVRNVHLMLVEARQTVAVQLYWMFLLNISSYMCCVLSGWLELK